MKEGGLTLKRVMTVLTILFAVPGSSFAEMSDRQGGGMANGGWWWGINSPWYLMILIVVLVITGIFLIMKREG